MTRTRFLRSAVFLFLLASIAPLAIAQQTGSIAGRVTTGSEVLPGVTVEARSNVLPQPRVTTTSANGEYRLPLLPPGRYTVTFNLSGLSEQTRTVDVLLNQEATLNASLGLEAMSESITVSAEGSAIDTSSTEIKSAVSSEVIEKLPVGQEYRDLVKLSPGVIYTETTVRGPSAGGSGQDNVYLFDGVNVSLPQYGTLSAEPSSHDIAQISVLKGGAQATDFNRSAGFLIDSVSKSGTNAWMGELGYQIQTDSMTSDQTGTNVLFDEDKSWANINIGGPVVRDLLFFYGSYYHPERSRDSRSNLYGDVPDFESTRDEFFGKLTFTPTSNLLFNGSYRDSDRENFGESVATSSTAGEGSTGSEGKLEIGILEGSWIVNNRSYASFKATDFANYTSGRPDLLLDVQPTQAIGAHIDVNNLDQYGRLNVPCPTGRATGAPCTVAAGPSNAYNNFIAPIIDRYGYMDNGAANGGGFVGPGRDIEQNDFFRKSYEAAYDISLGSSVTHDFHVGYQWNEDAEDLQRVRNGWGDITVEGGRTNHTNGTPIYYIARYIRSQLGEFPIKNIHSEVISQNFEINDVIKMSNWTFNLGVLVSKDTLRGQGLEEDSSTLSGYVSSPGTMYDMYEIDWDKMIQPRVGAMWAYNGKDTVYANYARYNPSATSLPRAASWDRNTVALFYEGLFDQNGDLFATRNVGSSSGKLFQDDLDPRYTDEYLIGTSREFSPAFTARAYARHRYSTNFWEDTPNNARVRWAPEGYPNDLYIPDLAEQVAQIGSGSSYVIAELDGAFTKYYELTTEAEWRGARTFVRGSYTLSHYYGNFDQDNTSGTNDLNIFIGSSNIADAPGLQIWDRRYGDLHGDRPHLLKLYGAYTLPWNASAGAFALYQSGEPWEAWDYHVYSHLPGSNTSSTSKYAEPAGSRSSPAHYQVDLNYTQNIPVRAYGITLKLDLFNLFDKQTGFNPQPDLNSASFGEYRNFYAPRRFQLSAAVNF